VIDWWSPNVESTEMFVVFSGGGEVLETVQDTSGGQNLQHHME